MLTDPFTTAACAETVSLVHALLRGIPDGACLGLSLTPLTAFVAISVFSIAIACLQAIARARVYGRIDPPGSHADSRHPAHEPRLSLREAANRARATRLHGPAD